MTFFIFSIVLFFMFLLHQLLFYCLFFYYFLVSNKYLDISSPYLDGFIVHDSTFKQ